MKGQQVKGKHGGPRANSGGARPGAGRTLEVERTGDPLAFLLSVMNNAGATPRLRIEAARAALPYMREAMRRRGKKQDAQAAAIRALRGFGPKRAPPLAVVGKK